MRQEPRSREARRTTFRPAGQNYLRITADGCVMDADMRMLQDRHNKKYVVLVCGEPKVKTMAALRVSGTKYLADVVTGSLYLAATGAGPCEDLQVLHEA